MAGSRITRRPAQRQGGVDVRRRAVGRARIPSDERIASHHLDDLIGGQGPVIDPHIIDVTGDGASGTCVAIKSCGLTVSAQQAITDIAGSEGRASRCRGVELTIDIDQYLSVVENATSVMPCPIIHSRCGAEIDLSRTGPHMPADLARSGAVEIDGQTPVLIPIK